MEAIDKATLREIVDLGSTIGKTVPTPSGGLAVILPDGYKVHEMRPVDEPEKTLKRIQGTAVLHDEASFVAYVKRYKTPATRIFAAPGFLNSGSAVVRAVFDYHEKDAPHHCAHAATYNPRYSDQWTKWAGVSSLDQVPFAEWIEENRVDITEPPAAALIDIVRTFKASKKVEFDSVVYQPNGDVKLAYAETSEAKGGTSSTMPEKLTLGIPVYFRGERYAVEMWVRYRVGNGKVVFTLKFDRPTVIEDDAFNKLIVSIAAATEIEVYLGKAGG